MTTTSPLGRFARTALVTVCVLSTVSCASQLTRTGRTSGFLVIEALEAASGAEPEKFGTQLSSDVVTLVEQTVNGQQVKVPTVFGDMGKVSMRISMRNPNLPGDPTSINDITITRYRIVFRRADGRNTPGVDVPHGFDGAVTVTLCACGTASEIPFNIVRIQMKEEPPLRNMVGGGGAMIISTIAEVTFFGRDQAGNEVSVSGSMTVNFGDFGDPK